MCHQFTVSEIFQVKWQLNQAIWSKYYVLLVAWSFPPGTKRFLWPIIACVSTSACRRIIQIAPTTSWTICLLLWSFFLFLNTPYSSLVLVGAVVLNLMFGDTVPGHHRTSSSSLFHPSELCCQSQRISWSCPKVPETLEMGLFWWEKNHPRTQCR